ncbi:hypothetical protein C8F04DRAFT_1181492 [Mycena alexandri]|uniref:Uncharacterized protein n=1 Tax=Mycena alexandri TaxID=1745969 RepID=A0AAD6X5Z7_9AGAR|nr:hypothetical protein C8F04DRAFT_1181492 [Mycena alexandri]
MPPALLIVPTLSAFFPIHSVAIRFLHLSLSAYLCSHLPAHGLPSSVLTSKSRFPTQALFTPSNQESGMNDKKDEPSPLPSLSPPLCLLFLLAAPSRTKSCRAKYT